MNRCFIANNTFPFHLAVELSEKKVLKSLFWNFGFCLIFCISYLLLSNWLPQSQWFKTTIHTYDLTDFGGPGIWEQRSRMVLVSVLSWIAIQDVSKGCGHLKAWMGFEDLLPRWLISTIVGRRPYLSVLPHEFLHRVPQLSSWYDNRLSPKWVIQDQEESHSIFQT